MNNKIIISTGGTGGHVIPAVNFGNFLIERGYSCVLILDKRGNKYSISFKGKVHIISSAHLSGNLLYKIKSIATLIVGFFQSLIIISKFRPKNCISFGGYATLMPLFVILILKFFIKINIYIHEQNSVIGKVNLFLIPFVKNCFTNFNFTKNINKKYFKKTLHVGLPSDIKNLQNNSKIIKEKDKTIIFIYGGSQGSIPLINKFLLMLKKLNLKSKSKISIILQAKKEIHNDLINLFKVLKLDFKIQEFYYNIGEILSYADLAITRAGAGTINDLIIHNIPSIIMPLPYSINNHQYYNAKFLSDKNAAILIDENNFDVNINSNILKELIINKNKRNLMIKELSKIHIPSANMIMLSKIK